MLLDTILAGYSALFAAAFVAATILPAQSEMVLSGLLVSGSYDPVMLILVATLGNVLGSTVNWALGRFFSHYRDTRWFPIKSVQIDKAERWFARFGPAVLLLSWVPIIGDPLTLVAGLLKMRLMPFLLIVTLAKAGRYIILALVVLGIVQ